jgi:hypothetical protein
MCSNTRMRKHPRATAVAVAITMTMLTSLTACGGDETKASDAPKKEGFADQDVEKIQAQVEEDMADLKSVRLKGDVTKDGQQLGLDLALNTDSVCAGSITIEEGTAEIIAGPDGEFLKGDDAFWAVAAGGEAQATQIVSLLDGKWAKMPGSGSGFAEVCDLDSMLSEFTGSDEDTADSKIGDQVEIDGVDTLELTDDKTDPTTVWVAIDDPHYIVKVTKEGSEGGTVTLTDFDEEVDATAPAEDDIVDLGKLG